MQKIQNAIIERNINFITKYFFNSDNSLNDNVKFENELWDYKENLPNIGRRHNIAWARISKYVLSFHNNKGGLLFFGIRNNYEICKTNAEIDSKKFNDQIKKFISDRIYIDFINYARNDNGYYIGIAIIPPRGALIEYFIADAPYNDGKQLFKKGWSAIRNGDQSIILNSQEFDKYKKENLYENKNKLYIVDEPLFKILSPEYREFVYRKKYCEEILNGLTDKRTSIVSVTGIGGIGKTALATWAVLESYNKGLFEFIVSVTAKDRELTPHGINAIFPTITTFETVLTSILDTFNLQEYKKLSIDKQESEVINLLENSGGLLYIDNLETIEDARIINFLDHLPYGVKAITTSRRTRVRFSVYPIVIEKMQKDEVFNYLKKLSNENGLLYLSQVSHQQSDIIGENVDKIPLAIKWCARRSSTIQELITLTHEIKDSGRSSEELLEFSYRRIFDKMTLSEKSVLYTLACFDRGVETSLILFVCNKHDDIEFAIETLANDSLIVKNFNERNKLYEYYLMPLTRNFILSQLKDSQSNERQIRLRIAMYYDASDIKNEIERESMKLIRNQGEDRASVYISLAEIAIKDGLFEIAERHLKSAISIDKNNFRAYWKLGELYRHHIKQTTNAVACYELASQNINNSKSIIDKITFYREFGLLLLFTQDKNSKAKAQSAFEKSLSLGYDSISLSKLSELLILQGNYELVIDFIEKNQDNISQKDMTFIYPHLLKAYHMKHDMLKYAEAKQRLEAVQLLYR